MALNLDGKKPAEKRGQTTISLSILKSWSVPVFLRFSMSPFFYQDRLLMCQSFPVFSLADRIEIYANSNGAAVEQFSRLTVAEAKRLLADKGWSNQRLAQWWDYDQTTTSRIVNNHERKLHFDDALRGLPVMRGGKLSALPKLTVGEAKALLTRMGWSNRALAQRWGFNEATTSRIVNDPARKRHFDDALRGLSIGAL